MGINKTVEVLRRIIEFVCVLLILVPLIRSWLYYFKNGYLDDLDLFDYIILMLPFCLFWSLAQIVNHKKLKDVLENIGFIIAMLYFFIGLGGAALSEISNFIIIQSLLLVMIFPLLVMIYYLEYRNYKESQIQNDLDDVLDSGIDL